MRDSDLDKMVDFAMELGKASRAEVLKMAKSLGIPEDSPLLERNEIKVF